MDWRVGGLAAALALASCGAARADQLVWFVTSDDASAYIAVEDASQVGQEEADAAFSMSCAITGDEETIVYGVEPKALGQAIAGGATPSFHLVLDGKPDESGDVIADIHFGEMTGDWEYVVNGTLTYNMMDAKTIAIAGVGVDLTLPTDQMHASLQKFKDACDALESTGDGSEDDNSGN
jgi:hypothetical protein